MDLPDRVLEHLRQVIGQPDLTGTRYELGELIGRGGMGAVYRARDTVLDREVALKVLDGGAAVVTASAEARLLARLEHPSIVAVHEAGELPDGRAFFAMRKVEGDRLDAFLRAGPVLAARLSVFEKLCEAVGFAHSQGVVHRDLKPENIMVGRWGEVIVLDWGVALETGSAEPGVVVGTSRYMAPEQRSGGEVDGRADVYALGVLLEDLLLAGPPGRALRAIAAKARADRREDRYASAEALRRDVERFRDRLPVEAYAERPWEKALRFADRNRVLLLLVGSYVVVRVALFFLRPR